MNPVTANDTGTYVCVATNFASRNSSIVVSVQCEYICSLFPRNETAHVTRKADNYVLNDVRCTF